MIKKVIHEQLLNENKVQKTIDYWIRSRKLTKYLYTDKSIKEIVNHVSKLDPSGTNKYLGWITKQIFENGINIHNDILYESVNEYHASLDRITPAFIESLKNYETTSRNFIMDKEKILKNPKDINSFSTIISLTVFNVILKNFKSKSELKKLDEESKKIVKLYQSPYVEVVVPLSEEASCKYGAGTKWCTAAREENAFKHYSKNGLLVYVLPKNKISTYSKLAFYIPYDQGGAGFSFMAYDEEDRVLDNRLDMYEILMRYIKDEQDNILTRECQDVEKEIWHWYFQKEDEFREMKFFSKDDDEDEYGEY